MSSSVFPPANFALVVPGNPSNIGPNPVGLPGATNPGPGVDLGRFNNIGQALAFTNYGRGPVSSSTPYFEANTPINYAYTIMPWHDHTELLIQEYMLVFTSNYTDGKNGLTNMVPLFKLNDLCVQKHDAFRRAVALNNAKAVQFNNFLKAHGEAVIANYDSALRHEPRVAEELAGAYPDLRAVHEMAQHDDYRYETLFGILNRWSFCGVVVSKSVSTSPMAFSSGGQSTTSAHTLGVALAKCANVHNIWPGATQTGDRLYLVLRRDETRNHAFQFVPYASKTDVYPPARVTNYYLSAQDDNRVMCGHAMYIGRVNKRPDKQADPRTQDMAVGRSASLEQAKDATGGLPLMWVDLLI